MTNPGQHSSPGAGAPTSGWPPLPPLPPRPVPARRDRGGWAAPTRRPDVRTGVLFVLGLAAVGAALGPLWAWWSPARQPGFVIAPHLVQPVGESESFIAGDGRYAVITLAVGLAAGVLAWTRRAVRGPVVALAVTAGALAGGLLTEFAGHLVGGGRDHGSVNTLIPHLPLTVHLHALRVLEPLAAVLVYAICAAFAGPDDLGTGDPADGAPATDGSVGVDAQA